ncbi:cornifelin homolog A-like [Symsagittifera roscoffensis]|uniref:cornifelin homolog A-like n=1 Tax=Symsagittifera roscoffensis TaxID=84072 RepID=UPI00307B665D
MGEWNYSLFSCFGNIKVCLMGYFIPCYLEGKIAESLGESCIMHGCVWLILPITNWYCPAVIRGKVRESKGIEGSLIMDILMICFCGACAICQEYNEMGLGDALARS